ncbi:hypothetical protein [Planctomicrobium piriforme]|uniref:Uncharacterized protein n=1 Tax=Planctomicrobium piriforme TaxID=1576369 RepID=A0A1I3SQD7_9PLAN|nr:hypothetical protein [Planctomicrobium piriforme]SFJ60743.1 hypothetical protein SAMN05421753_12533 [Planctomicrobium piriforme]
MSTNFQQTEPRETAIDPSAAVGQSGTHPLIEAPAQTERTHIRDSSLSPTLGPIIPARLVRLQTQVYRVG